MTLHELICNADLICGMKFLDTRLNPPVEYTLSYVTAKTATVTCKDKPYTFGLSHTSAWQKSFELSERPGQYKIADPYLAHASSLKNRGIEDGLKSGVTTPAEIRRLEHVGPSLYTAECCHHCGNSGCMCPRS